jgi:hypothetical protein
VHAAAGPAVGDAVGLPEGTADAEGSGVGVGAGVSTGVGAGVGVTYTTIGVGSEAAGEVMALVGKAVALTDGVAVAGGALVGVAGAVPVQAASDETTTSVNTANDATRAVLRFIACPLLRSAQDFGTFTSLATIVVSVA